MYFTKDDFQEGDLVRITGGRKIKKGTILEVDRCTIFGSGSWTDFYVIFKDGRRTAYRNCTLEKRKEERTEI